MARLSDVLTACNQVSRTCGDKRGPILPSDPTNDQCAAWLAWNDAAELAFYVREAADKS